ncbi:VOC family protein [Brevibacillus daliensis]|uniref:VOC family protein n=1 Tax=Brevibacillus daliensis TaxID=2892995 RepID=UPI001E3A523B|nr:VOC family protein [Brevibacillus daliensis]
MSYSFTGIEHVQIAAPKGCEDQAREFYGSVLGMKELPKPANLVSRGGCWFIVGQQELHIGVQENFTPATKAHPGFLVQNLQQLREKLTQSGITIKEEPSIDGRTRFFVTDPFGNRIEFLEFN